MALAVKKLQSEYSKAERIQSKSTRMSVREGLLKMLAVLKTFSELPNGVALFYGDGQMLVYEPKAPLRQNIYSCDSKFVLEPLYQLMKQQKKYCLLVIDGKEATIAIINSSEVKILKHFDSLIPSKTNKGGQSARRYQRLIESATREFYNRIAEVINIEFHREKFDSVLVGGCGYSKEVFLKEKLLNYQIAVRGVFDTSYTDESGIYELINYAQEVFKNDSIGIEKTELERFKLLASRGQALYGAKAVEKLQKASKIIIADKEVPNINLDGLHADILVVSSEYPAGKEFMNYAKGIGIIE